MEEPLETPDPEAVERAPDQPVALRTVRTPAPEVAPRVADVGFPRMGQGLEGPSIGASFNAAPLPTFINEVFHERLGFSFHISAALQGKDDLVTLRLAEPVPPAQLFETARRVLRDYGVDIVQEDDGMLSFVTGMETGTGGIPLLISGRTLPEVPATHREIFQLVPLRQLNSAEMRSLLLGIFSQHDLTVDEPSTDALLLRGTSDMVGRALATVEVLDRPLLRGRSGAIIEPTYLEAASLAVDLIAMLTAEGYQMAQGPGDGGVLVLPLQSINRLAVFTPDSLSLAHVEEWASVLDARQQEAVESGWFTYLIRHAEGEELASTLRQLLVGGPSPAPQRESGSPGAGSAMPVSASALPAPGRIVFDKVRNMLLFRGSGHEWTQLRAVIEDLDRPVPMVLIEAVIAEISLTDQEGSGIEFLARAALDDRRGVRFGTLDALGVQAKALSLALDSAGNTRALLNLFAEDSRVLIRSRPRLVVGSGGQASFQGGNQIPTVTQIADAGTEVGGTTNILQQVQYRQTGVGLTIEPTVQANGSVSLDISLELSEARPTAATSLAGTPTILTRDIDTKLTLRDGGSLVMGGLISDNKSVGETRVPGLARMPLLGRLFRTNSYQRDRTELIIMVIPYVITDARDGDDLTERLKGQLELHARFAE